MNYQSEPQKASSPALMLWVSVLSRAVTDATLLLSAIERNPDVSFDCMFRRSVRELKQWFCSKRVRVGSAAWICLLADTNQEKLITRMRDDFFSKINKIIKENKPREAAFIAAKKAELLRKKQVARAKRLAGNCCDTVETETPSIIFSDWLSNDTDESVSRQEKPKRPTIIRKCKHHGETEFAFYKRQNGKTDYTCMTCRKIRQENENEKRRKESAEMRQLRIISHVGGA